MYLPGGNKGIYTLPCVTWAHVTAVSGISSEAGAVFSTHHVPGLHQLGTEAVFPLQMAVLISVGFLSSWTPYAAASFWSIFNSSDSLQPIVTLLPCLFAKSSTAYNPFIYYIFSKTFRREIKQLQCCWGWRLHFFSTDTSAENPVSMMWSGRDNVRLSSTAKVENQGAAAH